MSHKGLILDKHGHNYSVHADCKLDKQHYLRALAVKVCGAQSVCHLEPEFNSNTKSILVI